MGAIDLAQSIDGLGHDERSLMQVLVSRLEAGQSAYGPWNVFDGRDYTKEALEEVVDALHYCAAELVRKRRMQSLRTRRVYVCHPFANDPQDNMERVRRIARTLIDEGVLPIAPHLYLPQLFDESSERERALDVCLQMLELCDEVRVFGTQVRPGMQREIEHALACRIPVVTVEEA